MFSHSELSKSLLSLVQQLVVSLNNDNQGNGVCASDVEEEIIDIRSKLQDIEDSLKISET